MTNAYVIYYKNQAGGGLNGFEGYEYMRGHGFFGSLFKNILVPLGKYIGKRALETGVNIGTDVLEGQDLKNSLSNNFKKAQKRVLEDTAERVKKFAQTGKGRKRKRMSIKKKKRPVKIKMKSVKKKTTKRKRKSLKKNQKKSKNRRSAKKNKFDFLLK